MWDGLDAGQQEHFADVLDDDGERLGARTVANDQPDREALLATRLSGTPGVVIDQPGAIARLALAVAARQGTPVAHVPGLVLRRAADVLLAMLRTGQPYQCARPAPCPARAA